MSLIQLKNISKKFKDNVVLDEVSVEFDLDEFVVILGESGCGKSTLLNILDFSLTPDKGLYFLFEKEVKKNIGFVKKKIIKRIHQKSNLIEYYTVYDNLKLACLSSNVDEITILPLLEKFKLTELKDKYPNQISVGEAQRVSIIRALACNPTIILADEPTGSLDEKNSKVVMDTLYKNRKGKLIIVVTHDENIAKLYGETIIRISEGKLIKEKEKEKKKTPYKKETRKREGIRIKDIFLFNLKSLKKRIYSSILLTIIITIIGVFVFVIFGLEKGIKEYIKSELLDKVDGEIFQIYYINQEGKMEEKIASLPGVLSSKISFNNIFNNYFYQNIKVSEKPIDFYFEVSFIDDKNLYNGAYINTMFFEELSITNLEFVSDDINEKIEVLSILDEAELYNVPRIFLSYEYWEDLLQESGMLEQILKQDISLSFVKDYRVIDEEKVYDFLSNSKDYISFYKYQIVQTKDVFVYNNSNLMIRETFFDLLSNIFYIVRFLSFFVLVFLSSLFIFVFRYSFFQRRLEYGILVDNGADKNDLSKFVLSEVSLLLSLSLFLSSFLSYLLSCFIFENSQGILGSKTKFNVLPFDLYVMIKIFVGLFLVSLVLIIYIVKSIKNKALCDMLKEE